MPRNQRKLKWKEFPSSLVKVQYSLFENWKDSDVVIVSSDGQKFKAHRLVLSMCSEFLHAILLSVSTETIPTIHMPDVNSTVLYLILQFIYTGEAIIPSETMSKFSEACDFLKISCFSKNKVSILHMNADELDIVKENESAEITENRTEGDITPFVILHNVERNEVDGDDFSIEYLEFDENNDQYMEDCDTTSGGVELIACENVSHVICSEGNDDSIENLQESTRTKRKLRQKIKRGKNSTVESVLSEISKGKTINQLSIEHNLPRSTLYHRFRKDANLKQNYRSERRSALDQAVRSVIEDRMSLKKASDRYNLPKTAIWRELRKYHQYKPPEREVPQERLEAQSEIITGKSLTSISMKYGIPLTTLHRDKKRLSSEGKLPDSFRCKDRKEKSEFSQRLEQALQKCRQGMSQYQAARMYNIPKATMWRYAHALLKNVPTKSSTEDGSEELQIEMAED